MILKFQNDVPGEQPNVTANGVAVMSMPIGPRIGVLYVEAIVTKAAGGAGVTSLPLVTDIISPTVPILVQIDTRDQRSRLVTELITDNLLQDKGAGGSVTYYQGAGGNIPANQIAVVNNANNASYAGLGLAANTATTAVFQVPIYFCEYWRSDIATRENLAWPTAFTNGTVLKPLTASVQVANNGGGAFSGWDINFWYDYDGLQGVPVNGNPTPFIVKKARRTKAYAVAGDATIPFVQKDLLMQFSVILAAGDQWSKIQVKKNGTTIKTLTPNRNFQIMQDHGMNTATIVANRVDCVFDLNDDLNAALPLATNDTFEVIVTLSTVVAAAQMVLLTESYGLPD